MRHVLPPPVIVAQEQGVRKQQTKVLVGGVGAKDGNGQGVGRGSMHLGSADDARDGADHKWPA
jgi:hypothetical protein